MVDAPFNHYLAHLCARHKAIALLPPKVIAAFHITWNEKDGERNLQLTCERKGVRIVIAVAIIEGQHQRYASITHPPPIFVWHVKFLQCCLKMEYTIMTTQIEQVAAQVSPSRAMVIEDNQTLSRSAYPPACQSHKSTIVEAGCNKRQYALTHECFSIL